ncbi:hypothetical protein F0U61_38610 [Archangium violaceum]|uniref:hypothetical protein n=1 Tax=Archangium violaceum TaxID=83451 RepID=UPI002B2EA367|nr:hypothetical protein F0U61_38610 [Archangium violaceum]
MNRAHLFEFNDMPWLPMPVRKTLMEQLHHMAVQLRLYEAGFDALSQVLDRAGTRTLQALCAGDGGLILALSRHLGRDDIRIMMSDKFPSLDSFRERERESGGRLGFHPDSVDVLDVPEHMEGLRLIVNAVHHFEAPQVRGILADAVSKRQPIVFMEPVQRDLLSIVRFCAAAPLLSLYFSVGGIRPLSPRRTLLGAVVPLGSLCFFFDGIVSHLRAYHTGEWEALIREVDGHERFTWETRILPGFMGSKLTMLTGLPKELSEEKRG